MKREWTVTLACEVAGAILMGLVERQARQAAGAEVGTGRRVVRYGWAIRSLLMAMTALTGGLAVYVPLAIGIRGRADLVILFATGVAAIASGCATLQAFFGRLTLGEKSIISHSPWRLPHELDWAEITRVTYSPMMGRFLIRGSGGEKIRVTRNITGINTFGESCRAHLRYDVYRGDAYFEFDKIDKERWPRPIRL